MKLLVLLLSLILPGCLADNNDLIKELLYAKRVTQDSLDYAARKETEFKKGAVNDLSATKDSANYLRLMDSSAKYHRLYIRLDERIKKIGLTIDSLSKIK